MAVRDRPVVGLVGVREVNRRGFLGALLGAPVAAVAVVTAVKLAPGYGAALARSAARTEQFMARYQWCTWGDSVELSEDSLEQACIEISERTETDGIVLNSIPHQYLADPDSWYIKDEPPGLKRFHRVRS